jgi:hypothetical protein
VTRDKQPPSRPAPDYEFVQAKWLHQNTFDKAGEALRRDLEKSVATWEWVKTDRERKLLVLEHMIELGESFLQAAIRELRREERGH